MSDPWKFIYEQTGFDPLDRYAREEREKRAADEHLRDESETGIAGSRWQYCEIVCIRRGFFGGKSYFVAQAAGSKGTYEAARSTKPFYAQSPTTSLGEERGWPETNSGSEEEKAKTALNEIMSKLSGDGWELTGQKGRWWEYKYRRRERS